MERVLLYYPTIDIPNKEWLHSAILYTDKVASIVPNNDCIHNNSTIEFLIDQDQYIPIYIQNVFGHHADEFSEFENLFIDTASSPDFCKLSSNKAEFAKNSFKHIYQSKLTNKIIDYFQDRHLIESVGNDTIQIDGKVALLYMGILAQYVTKVTDDNLIIPSTDVKAYETISYTLVREKNPAFSFIFDKCLPVPMSHTKLEDIIAFKKKRRNELLEFRKFLTRTQDKISKATSSQEVKEIQVETIEAIEKEISELEKLYKDRSIKTFFTSFESLLKLENPKLFQSLTTIGAVTTPINPIAGIATALFGIVGGIASSYLTNNKEINRSELSYLFKAKQQGII